MKIITITIEANNEDELLEEMMGALGEMQTDFCMSYEDNDLQEMRLVTSSMLNPSDSFITDNLSYLMDEQTIPEDVDWITDYQSAAKSHLLSLKS